MRVLCTRIFLPALIVKSCCVVPSAAFQTPLARPAQFHVCRARFSMASSEPDSATPALREGGPETALAKAPVRILALHGFSQDAENFRKKTGSLRKGLKDSLEMVYVDAPCVDTHSTIGEGRSWYEFSKVDENGNMVWEKFEDTLVYLDQVFRDQGPFDGVFGFSQGACVAAMLSALQEAGEAPPNVRFQRCLMFSGFLPKDAKWSAVCAKQKVSKVQSLHVIGEKDELVHPDRSLRLAEMFENPTIAWHNKGHLVPSDRTIRDAFRAFIFGPSPSAESDDK